MIIGIFTIVNKVSKNICVRQLAYTFFAYFNFTNSLMINFTLPVSEG